MTSCWALFNSRFRDCVVGFVMRFNGRNVIVCDDHRTVLSVL